MSVPERPPAPAPIPLRCPRCGASVAPEQDWCLECGAPARTRLAPTPNWRLPIAAVAAIVLVAGVALALAFSALTTNDGVVTAATTAATVPAQPDAAATASVPAPPPSNATTPTTPAATTPTAPPAATAATPPAATATTPGATATTTTPGR